MSLDVEGLCDEDRPKVKLLLQRIAERLTSLLNEIRELEASR